jgi:phospholipase C
MKNKTNTKSRHRFVDLMKRAAAAATAAAIFATPTGFTFAARPNPERQKSEHAVQRLRHIMVIYQENWSFDSLYGHGGRWDHVAPPVRNDGWGTGVRVPAIIISPLARTGFVDHRQYETVSILKLLESRFNLQPLSTRDADPAVNDL